MKVARLTWIISMSVLGVALCIAASLALGSRTIPLEQVLQALIVPQDQTFSSLVVRERIPRTVFGLMAGAALGVSGTLMQAVTRNPIADPSILGVNTGASLFVVIGIAFFQIHLPSQYIWFALAGAAVTALFVYGVGSLGQGGATPIKLALAGAATSAALSSMVSGIILPRTEVMNAFRFWQVGTISGATWEGIGTVLPFLTIGMVVGLCISPALNAMALGDEVATGLGVKVGWVRMLGALAGVTLCGAITALAGPIGFVGLMIPHVMRLVFGQNMKSLIFFSALGGAFLLVSADVIGRLIGNPSELEAGIVTAFLGAPVLIWIARRAKVRTL